MAFAVTTIQQNTNTTTGVRTITVPVGGVPSGALIVISVGDASNAAANTGSVADAGSNTYTFQQGISANGVTANGFAAMYTAPVTTPLTSGQLITYTKAVSGNACRVMGCYVTGQDVIDTVAGASNSGNSTTTTVTSGTPAVADSLFIGMFTITAGGATINHPGGDWVPILDGTTVRESGCEYLIGTGTSTQTYNPTFNTAKDYANCIIVISPPTGGDVTVGITGVAATGAVGSVATSRTLSATGVAGTGQAGNVAPSDTVPSSGVSGTGQVGTPGVNITLAIGGVSGTGAVGDVTASVTGDVTIAISGVAATGEVGTVTPTATGNVTIAIGGVQATGQVGNVGVDGGGEIADSHDPGLRKRLKKREERRRKQFEDEAAERARKRALIHAAYERIVDGKLPVPQEVAAQIVTAIEEPKSVLVPTFDFAALVARAEEVERLWAEHLERDDEDVLVLL